MKTNTTLTLATGQTYDITTLRCVGWTTPNGTAPIGYNWSDYFREGVYLGPDEDGIEPVIEVIE